MSPNTTMSLMLLVVVAWVATVQSECITNPMDEINRKAKEQHQTAYRLLNEMEKSTPIKYQNLMRVYGIYRACIESGTQRWTDNIGDEGSVSCPYCRTKIEKEDEIQCGAILVCFDEYTTKGNKIILALRMEQGKDDLKEYIKKACKLAKEHENCMKHAVVACPKQYSIPAIKFSRDRLEGFNKPPFNCAIPIGDWGI